LPPDEVVSYDFRPDDIGTEGTPFEMMDAIKLAGTDVVPPLNPLAVLWFCARWVSDWDANPDDE
jgi:hypothetical protein